MLYYKHGISALVGLCAVGPLYFLNLLLPYKKKRLVGLTSPAPFNFTFITFSVSLFPSALLPVNKYG